MYQKSQLPMHTLPLISRRAGMNQSPQALSQRWPDPGQLTAWFETTLGRHLLACERKCLAPMARARKGLRLLQLGTVSLELDSNSPISHQIVVHNDRSAMRPSVLARHEALPLAGETIDIAILHHALDFSEDPHQLLREVSRVLIAGGQIIICGFNPLSTWGLRRLLSFNRGRGPWQASMMTAPRLADWLKLLDFRVTETRYGAYCWPVDSACWVQRTSVLDTLAGKLNWPTGAMYMISARKQLAPLSPAGDRRSLRSAVAVGIPLVEKVAPNAQSRFIRSPVPRGVAE